MSAKLFYIEDPVGSIFDKSEIEIINKTLNSKKILTRGKNIKNFEQAISNYCRAKYAIAVSSCGAALNLTSKILNLKQGDEVICQGNMFWAGINHLLEKKVVIKCADIDSDLNISINSLSKLISKKTKAIYLMHHGGYPADLFRIRQIAKKYSIPVVEDCAHALGSVYRGKKIGHDSDLACFSFSTLKNITTLGEGGMILTNNKKFYDRAIQLRTNFPIGKFIHDKSLKKKFNIKFNDLKDITNIGNNWIEKVSKVDEIGSTYRLGEVQSAVGIQQIKKLNFLIKKRKDLAKRYNNFLNQFPKYFEINQKNNKKFKSSYHLYSFLLKKNNFFTRNELANKLRDHGIDIKIRFMPIHFNSIMRLYGCKLEKCKKCNSLKNLENIWLNLQMSLPISPHKTKKQVDKMLLVFRKVLKKMEKKNKS